MLLFPQIFRFGIAHGSARFAVGEQGSRKARAAIARGRERSATGAKGEKSVSRSDVATERIDVAIFEELAGRRCAGANGLGNAIA